VDLVEDEKELVGWPARHHKELFEEELRGWYTNSALRPRDRSLEVLQEWCSFELHTVVVDSVSLRSKTMSSKNEACWGRRNSADQSY
jgi:hypothetical protein